MELANAKTNPNAHWQGALSSLSTADADLILAAGLGAVQALPTTTTTPESPIQGPSAETAVPATTSATPSAPTGLPESQELFDVGERLKKFLKDPKPINEDGTRAFFIDRVLSALGYSDFDDLEHGSGQASGTFPDYIHVRAVNA